MIMTMLLIADHIENDCSIYFMSVLNLKIKTLKQNSFKNSKVTYIFRFILSRKKLKLFENFIILRNL